MKNTLLSLAAAAALSCAFTFVSFAGQWTGSAETGWNYLNDDGSRAIGWNWIDGDGNGISESYYFDASGVLLINTTTPDGYTVNENGAWIENGAVKTQKAQNSSSTSSTPASDSFFEKNLSAILGSWNGLSYFDKKAQVYRTLVEEGLNGLKLSVFGNSYSLTADDLNISGMMLRISDAGRAVMASSDLDYGAFSDIFVTDSKEVFLIGDGDLYFDGSDFILVFTR